MSIAPPIERFMTLQNPGELRIGEVLELLRDYRRLAGALKELGAFATPSTAAGSSPSPSSST